MRTTRRLTLASLLVAVMMVLGYVESLIPISAVPGIKLGLSNCVLLIALYWLGVGMSVELMVVKVVLLGFLFGNPMMIAYSLAGGALSLAVMAALRNVRGVGPVGVGIAGGVTHNIGQVAMAVLTLQTPSLIYYLGLLIPVGAGMGLITGLVAQTLMHTLPPLKRLEEKQKREETQLEENHP